MSDFLKKHTLLAGAIALTAAGFASRILGFFYRIFLSRAIGAEGLGTYQMIFPIYGICFSLCAGSVQTAISRFAAGGKDLAKRVLLAGFLLSFSASLLLAAAVCLGAEWIAVHILMEPECAALLPAMALAIPCASLHACLCGYYYGKERVQVPAVSQLVEQGVRMAAVFCIADVCREQGIELTSWLAVAGLVIGEAASALFSLFMFLLAAGDQKEKGTPPPVLTKDARDPASLTALARALLSLALPLMATRFVMNVLQSAEAVLIPGRLVDYGLSRSQAVSLYGVLTGMSMHFILFPSAIVNSLAVVLLPSVAKHQSAGNDAGIARSVSMSFRYSLYMGICFTGVFLLFGDRLGLQVFGNADAGAFITILAWLCPFLYLATTMGSILNGLGNTRATFLHNLAALLVRLAFVFFGIPIAGIRAFLWGMLASELLLALLHILALRKAVRFSFHAWEALVKPCFCLFSALGIFRLFPDPLPVPGALPAFFSLFAQISIVCAAYFLLLLLFHRGRS